MHTKQAISLTIQKMNLQFVNDVAKRDKKTRSEIVDALIDAYRKYRLKKGIIAGFKSQSTADVTEAMSDFSEYLTVVDKK